MKDVLIRLGEDNVGGAVSSPSSCDGKKDFRLCPGELRLLFRTEQQVAIALALRSQRGENPAAYAKVRGPHVRAFHRSFQAERNSSKIRDVH